MTAYQRRVVVGFGLGGLLAALITTYVGPTYELPILLYFPLGPLLGGCVAGASLRKGIGVIVGFALGLVIPGYLMPAALMALMQCAPQEVLVYFTLLFAFLFGLAGAIGAAFIKPQSVKVVGASTAGFGLGGAIGGAALLVPWLLGPHSGRGLLIGEFICILIPFILGGCLLGAVVERQRPQQSERRKKVCFTVLWTVAFSSGLILLLMFLQGLLLAGLLSGGRDVNKDGTFVRVLGMFGAFVPVVGGLIGLLLGLFGKLPGTGLAPRPGES